MVTRKILSTVKLDDFIPTSEVCMSCDITVEKSTSHYACIVTSWINKETNSIKHIVKDSQVIQIQQVTESFYPKKKTGRVCQACFDTLYATTWYDKSGHLRRAIEVLHEGLERVLDRDKNGNLRMVANTSTPVQDEASPITKGLYAPHSGGSLRGAQIDESRPINDKLKGFNRR